MLIGGTASAFDYNSYLPENLDALLARKPPVGNGFDVFPFRKIRLDVTLAGQPQPCKSKILAWAMVTSGIPEDLVAGVPITHCVQVRSAKGNLLSVFIQDALVEGVAHEVKQGERVTLYATVVFFDQKGPGIIINEYSGAKIPNPRVGDCGCGRDFHSGNDFEAPEGTPVRAMADGVVVKVEQEETADVDVPSAGKCGRYVVVKHTYPNGRAFYTRYAQLGRLIGENRKTIALGQTVKAREPIGEVGSSKRFHFEIRPVDQATTDASAKWTQLYGSDASMDWSRYQPVDSRTFDADAFAKK